MIEFLKISSMAIFDEVELEFTQGLNCITGETGAGKSLVLGALMLLMGSRANQDMVRPGAQKAAIEALLTVSGRQVVLRREIYPTGSSRCYIDGKLATVNSLAEFSSGLITIYGQHEYQDLLNPVQQMAILEELAGLNRKGVQDSYEIFAGSVSRLKRLEQDIDAGRREKEGLLFTLSELQSLDLHVGREEELASELALANRSAELKKTVHLTEEILYSGSASVIDLTAQARDRIAGIAVIDHALKPLTEALGEIAAQVEDVSRNLRDRIATYEYDPEKIESLEQQLHFLQDLKHKHRTDEEGLSTLRRGLEHKLSLIEDSDVLLMQAKEEVSRASAAYRDAVAAFLKARIDFSRTFCKQVNLDLEALGMPGTVFKVQQADMNDLDALIAAAGAPGALLKGEFIISTNVGQKALSLAKTASGGELSRIMLAIKVRQEQSEEGTLIFDEIDSGISGQTALMIAQKLKSLSGHAQAVVVTHLHQVASVADSHFLVVKKTDKGSTTSTIRMLERKDRVMELARMMGGESPSTAVIKHAKELIGR